MRGRVQQYIAKRLLLFVPTLVLVTFIVFLVLRLIPSDPALLILAGATGDGHFTEEELALKRHELGTDRPLHVQYGDWVWGLLRGDLGTALYFQTDISSELGPRILVSLELALLATLASFIVAVPLGVLSAVKQDSIVDYAARIFTFTGISIPIFVTGLVIVYILARYFNWFAPLGYATPFEDPWKHLRQITFPVLALTFFQLNITARVARSSMLEVMREDYIRTARAKGLTPRKVIFLHAFKNAVLPVITVSGWSLGMLLGGTIVIEKIFLLPGMGTLLVDSVTARDYTLIQAEVLVFAIGILTVNLLVDLVYVWLDPRIRYA